YLLRHDCLEIKHDALLSTVEAEKVVALTIDKRRPPSTGLIPSPRLLDLNHLRAEIREYHRTEGSSKILGQVDHSQSFERQGHVLISDPDLINAYLDPKPAPRYWREASGRGRRGGRAVTVRA